MNWIRTTSLVLTVAALVLAQEKNSGGAPTAEGKIVELEARITRLEQTINDGLLRIEMEMLRQRAAIAKQKAADRQDDLNEIALRRQETPAEKWQDLAQLSEQETNVAKLLDESKVELSQIEKRLEAIVRQLSAEPENGGKQ
jgi:predicted  nucleic acid-binding Zn-ribbon protein